MIKTDLRYHDYCNFSRALTGLYLFVKIQGFDDIRTLAVERIIELTITGEAFKYPAGFEPDEPWILPLAYSMTTR